MVANFDSLLSNGLTRSLDNLFPIEGFPEEYRNNFIEEVPIALSYYAYLFKRTPIDFFDQSGKVSQVGTLCRRIISSSFRSGFWVGVQTPYTISNFRSGLDSPLEQFGKYGGYLAFGEDYIRDRVLVFPDIKFPPLLISKERSHFKQN